MDGNKETYTAQLLRGYRYGFLGTKLSVGPISKTCSGKYQAVENLLCVLEAEEQAQMEKKPTYVVVSRRK